MAATTKTGRVVFNGIVSLNQTTLSLFLTKKGKFRGGHLTKLSKGDGGKGDLSSGATIFQGSVSALRAHFSTSFYLMGSNGELSQIRRFSDFCLLVVHR